MGSGPSTSASSRNYEKVVVQKQDGQTLEVDSQIQFYTPNSLLSHPLISPCRAYLGGLPPLYFMAGDHEVLRDEIIYTSVSSLHCSVSLLTSDLEPIEQQTRPSTRFRTNPNDCTPRSRSSRRNTPLRLRSTSKFMMAARTSYPSFFPSPLLRSSVSGRSRVFVVSRLGCNLPVLNHLPKAGQDPLCSGTSQYLRLRQGRRPGLNHWRGQRP